MEVRGALLVVTLVMIATVPAIRDQLRADRGGSIRTLLLIALYVPFAMLGAAAILRLAPEEGSQNDAAPTFMLLGLVLLWMAYGGLWLVRLLPKREPSKAWMRSRPGMLDAGRARAVRGAAGDGPGALTGEGRGLDLDVKAWRRTGNGAAGEEGVRGAVKVVHQAVRAKQTGRSARHGHRTRRTRRPERSFRAERRR